MFNGGVFKNQCCSLFKRFTERHRHRRHHHHQSTRRKAYHQRCMLGVQTITGLHHWRVVCSVSLFNTKLKSSALQTLSKGFEKESRLVCGKNRASSLRAFNAPETFYQVGGDIRKVDKSAVTAVSIVLASLVNQFVSFRFQRICSGQVHVFFFLFVFTVSVNDCT